ncbi:enolase-phosphatase E1-like [Chironomus tepperi]|uniref:enolase-phosphatase E1-like n=1 Tax=Chironomus tepperi TaxID=113505 RepID=UPI00391F0959
MKFWVFFLPFISFQVTNSIPILSNDEKLNSIVISEINLPTEASLVIVDQEIVAEPVASFVDLVEKYEGMYGKETENEFTLQKRSSTDDDEDVGINDPDAGGKSLIDKIEIPDPEVKKEFENELQLNQIMKDDDETTENTNIGTEYDPNYERKLIALPQANENIAEVRNESAELNIHDKENLQVQLVEQLVHQNENQFEFTTIVPEEAFTDHTLVLNPEIVEVLEHIVYEVNSESKPNEHTTSVPIPVLNMDIDPIEIIPKDRHREAKEENSTDLNDKFAGFVGIPNEDLIQPGEETTEPDSFFKEKKTEDEDDVNPVDTLRETLEYVAIYGRSLNNDDSFITTEIPQTTTIEHLTATPLISQTTPVAEQFYETKTEIVEVNVDVTINNQIGSETDSKKSSSSEESSQQSLPSKSSEENDSKEEKEKIEKKKVESPSTSSEEVEAENLGKEDLSDEKMDLRSLEFPVTQRPNVLPEEIFKDSTVHEIKKKDNPDGIELTYEFKGRQLSNDDPVTEDGSITMTTVIETFEEVVTTISEGINLSKELRRHVESFRGDSEENKIILDTDNEIISSKNFKNPLVGVNDLEMMKLKERSFEEEPKLSVAIIPFVAVMSTGILFTLYKFVKGKTSSVRLY